ncbi:hypothetical protein EDD18DRAFT_127704 [Armillaria luteobubalina]|uniref:Uncharacterized protein n=1 Tax=Armillaria luteobubalina TaxID=153913 RepID=A0AA39QA94_9AGAR|nr:hypothetical protein EDD18DRAFT_127704 [Armillaria luteobubalina]
MSSSPTDNASYSLALDPGTPRRQRLACSCCKWSAVVIGLLTVLLVCVSVFKLHPLKFVDNLRHPHGPLYHNGSLEEQAVVQPLIDGEQQFNIAVSVWLRAPKEEEEEWRKLSSTVDDDTEGYPEDATLRIPISIGDNSKIEVHQVVDKSDPNYDIYLKGDKKLLYTPLYSDVAFHEVNLKDKSVFADVHFQIPISRFLDRNLTTSDLRGTFVLIPSSKSLLKHVTNFSSWMPDAVVDNLPPVRSWPFPLGSSFYAEKTLADLAVDSFGISVPLLQFSEIPSRCADSSVNATDQATSASKDTAATSFDLVKKDIPAYKNHPHVVRRTKLHVVDETHFFGKEAYDKAHQSLRSTSCGQHPGTFAKPSRKFCKKLSFSKDGVFRTSLELNVPNANGGYERRWAYGPFMDTISASPIPKDIIPVPVNRENCSVSVDWPVDAPEVPGLMDITWRISFSGLSPAKHLLSTVIPPLPVDVNNSRSDFEMTSKQDIAELIDGLRGVRFDDESHPRRRIIISTIGLMTGIFSYIFEILYWFTRVHTVAISTTGTLLRASSLVIETSLSLDLKSENSALRILANVVLSFIFGFQLPIHMFRVALRLEFYSTRRSILGMSLRVPVIRRVPKTHKERSSERLDKRTNWKVILCSMLVIYYIATPLKYDVIDALHPPRPEQEFSKSYEYVLPGLHAISVTAMILQIMLNHRSQVFAGNYRTSTYLNFLVILLNLMGYVPAIVGRPESRASLSLNDCIVLVVAMIEAVQAFTLPNARMEDDEDNE